jgi:hypothetical protein
MTGFASLQGVDHLMLIARDLARARDQWVTAGFTLSSLGRHSDFLGTANHTVMFGDDYIEIMGFLAETPANQPFRHLIDDRGEGVRRIALRSRSVAETAADQRAAGLNPPEPLHFSRPVPVGDGETTSASFNVIHWPADRQIGAFQIFACEHLTPEAVWQPALLRHPNTARSLLRTEVISPDPRAEAAGLAAIAGGTPERLGPDVVQLHPGGRASSLEFMTEAAFCRRHPALEGKPVRHGPAAVVIGVADLAVARGLVPQALPDPAGIILPADMAAGIAIVFSADQTTAAQGVFP